MCIVKSTFSQAPPMMCNQNNMEGARNYMKFYIYIFLSTRMPMHNLVLSSKEIAIMRNLGIVL